VPRASIAHGLRYDHPLRVDPAAYPEALRLARATFVTLHRAGRLRGCVGTLEARQALVADVAESAWGAAFRDPRFERVGAEELAELAISISVLGALEPLRAASGAELAGQLEPGVHGLVLREGSRRGTLLPAVWRHVPDPRHFVREVMRKADLPEDHWSAGLEAFRYEVESISD
jgi:AmmeMemoRadiSam system protein A